MKNKTTAGILAIFFGGLGVHRFYLNQIGLGILYLFFCWTLIPLFVGIIDGIIFLTMEDGKFNLKYNTTPAPSTQPVRSAPNQEMASRPGVYQSEENNLASLQINPLFELVELNSIQKLQFRKYIAEQSGMNVSEVDNYLTAITDSERADLIRSFVNRPPEVQNNFIQAQPVQTVIPTINVIQENSNLPSCPKCKSKEVTYNKQGFGVGKAFVGAVLTGGVGLLAGGINKNKILLTCLKCGHRWKRG